MKRQSSHLPLVSNRPRPAAAAAGGVPRRRAEDGAPTKVQFVRYGSDRLVGMARNMCSVDETVSTHAPRPVVEHRRGAAVVPSAVVPCCCPRPVRARGQLPDGVAPLPWRLVLVEEVVELVHGVPHRPVGVVLPPEGKRHEVKAREPRVGREVSGVLRRRR